MSFWRADAKKAKQELFSSIFAYVSSLKVVIPYFFGIGEHRKVVTEQYPDPVSSRTDEDLPAKTRGRLENDIDLCTGCGVCAERCPAQCIQLKVEPGPEPEKKWVSVFNIDLSRCFYCGLCTEVCEPTSLTHIKKFTTAEDDKELFIAKFGRGEITFEQRQKWNKIKQQEEGMW